MNRWRERLRGTRVTLGQLGLVSIVSAVVSVLIVVGALAETGPEKAVVAALEVAKSNIRINAIAPGSVMTPLLTNMFGSEQGAKDTVIPLIPMGRISDPSEIAQLVLFLASDGASFITGQAVVIDGGGFVANA